MKMFHHKKLPLGSIHPPHNWEAASLTIIQPEAGDENKWALVGDRYYRLVSVDPIEWKPLNTAIEEETNAVFTYEDGLISRIDYASGNYRLFDYADGRLIRVDYHKGLLIIRKDLIYEEGVLIQILDTVI